MSESKPGLGGAGLLSVVVDTSFVFYGQAVVSCFF
jgi:hypothetical protein